MDGKRRRGWEREMTAPIPVEVHSPTGFGRVRMRGIPRGPGVGLAPLVFDVVKTGSDILTDGWSRDNELSGREF